MALVLINGPSVEPVTVAEAKAHLKIDHTDEDILIASLVLTSRLHVEAALDLALIDQAWRFVLDQWPGGGVVEVPIAPLQSIERVAVRNSDGVAIAVPASRYLVDLSSKPPRIVWNAAERPLPGVPINGIEIELIAGFGPDGGSVPAPLKHAILMLTAHWYEHRDPMEVGAPGARLPDAVSDLIQPFRKIRL